MNLPIEPPPLVDRREMMRRMNEAVAITPDKTAIVTIDCHRGHLDPQVATMPVPPQHARAVVNTIRKLLDNGRAVGMPVIHVILQNRILPNGIVEPMHNPFWKTLEDVNLMLTPQLKSTVRRHNMEGSVQTQLMPDLGPAPTDLIINTKRRLSIFRDTDLDLTIQELGVDTLVLVGVNTNTCVLCAAFESLNRDLKTIVIADAVHSMYGDDLHFFGLQNIARCLGWVFTLNEFIAKLAQGDRTMEWRTTT